MSSSEHPWFIAQLKPNAGAIAHRNLDRQGFASFMPLKEATRQVRNKLVTEARPVFPGYLFVTFDPASAPWRKINSTLGVVRLLSTPSGVPAMVPQGFMTALLDRCDPDGLLQPERLPRPGDMVRIMTGPFADTITRIESLDGMGRVGVLLELMGQSIRTTLPIRDVQIE